MCLTGLFMVSWGYLTVMGIIFLKGDISAMKGDTLESKIKLWTQSEYFDEATRREIVSLDPKELEERFASELEFGTAGMRGKLGAGPNRLNIYVVRRLAWGLAQIILEQGEEASKRGVVIAYDNRRYSQNFAREIISVLAASNIRCYIFDGIRPTPELSFALRHLNAIAGVMITASHNPKEYNGCKVYWEDGGQIPPNLAKAIEEKIKSRDDWFIPTVDLQEARDQELLVQIGEEVDETYLREVKDRLLHPELTAARGDELKVVYTPLHGTGLTSVKRLLTEIGFSSLFIVQEQATPDPEFSTVPVPNPEEVGSFNMALDYACLRNADLVLATDPDADRLGIMTREAEGTYRNFTGNEIGVILLYYLLSQLKEMESLPGDGVAVKSIASTDLAKAIAQDFGVHLVDVLVGFKYVAEQIKAMEERGQGSFIFGFEESNGYLAGTYTRDKDAVQAAALVAEAALYYREKEGKTLGEKLEEIYKKYGYYLDRQVALTFEGIEGKAKINKIMKSLREAAPTYLGPKALSRVEDYSTGKGKDLIDGSEYSLNLPKADVIKFFLEGGGYVMARPSGTEPKIRFYFCIRGASPEETRELLEEVKSDFLEKIGCAAV